MLRDSLLGDEFMKSDRRTPLAVILCAVAGMASAADPSMPVDPADHSTHHQDSARAKGARQHATKSMQDQMAGMDAHMKNMQAMHEKMVSAKTPDERSALMAEHTRSMQDGMSMMNGVSGARGMSGMSGADPMPGGAGLPGSI